MCKAKEILKALSNIAKCEITFVDTPPIRLENDTYVTGMAKDPADKNKVLFKLDKLAQIKFDETGTMYVPTNEQTTWLPENILLEITLERILKSMNESLLKEDKLFLVKITYYSPIRNKRVNENKIYVSRKNAIRDTNEIRNNGKYQDITVTAETISATTKVSVNRHKKLTPMEIMGAPCKTNR